MALNNNLRKLVTDYSRKIAVDIRGFLLPAVYGLCGGLAAVSFQSALNITFSTLWQGPSQQMEHGTFAFFSLLTIVVTSISASLILMFVSYGDLETMLGGGITGWRAMILLIAKLAATIAIYAWGGVGGIFSPTLFFGAAVGLVFGDLCGFFLNLGPSDRIALTVAGMSACFGAVVRAPITSVLIVFEMTHQFSLVPLLMIGTIASQAVSRSLCRTGFYNGVIEEDGVELDRYIESPSAPSVLRRAISAPD